MENGITREINFGEYIVIATYYGDGKIDVSIVDELGEEIEGIYISECDDDDNVNYNLN